MPLIYNPLTQLLDANGDAYSGAKMYVYDAGTVDLRTTYSDSALTTANANPLIADSAGRFGPLYLAASATDYKLKFDTADDVLIDTQDNLPVSALDQATLGLILYPRTAAEISAGVTPKNFSFEPGNVKRYGAVGDGGADDTTAIQDAIDVAEINFGRVWLPAASNYYLITATLIIAKQIRFVGAGRWNSIIKGSVSGPLIRVTNPANRAHLSHFGLSNSHGTIAIGIHFEKCDRSTAENIEIHGEWSKTANPSIGFHNDGCQQLYMKDLWMTGNGSQRFSDNELPLIGFDHESGVGPDVSNATTMEHCHATGCDTIGCYVHSTEAYSVNPPTINLNNCVFQGNGVNLKMDKVAKVYLASVHCEAPTAGTIDIELINVDYSTFIGILGNQDLTDCKSNIFLGGRADTIAMTDDCSHNIYINVILRGNPGVTTYNVPTNTNRFIGCRRGVSAVGFDEVYGDINTGSYVVSTNGNFNKWNSGLTAPIGYSSYDSATLSRSTVDPIAGTYNCRITSTGGSTLFYPGVQFDLADLHQTYFPRPADISPGNSASYLNITVWIKRPVGQTTIPRIGTFQGFERWHTPESGTVIDDEWIKYSIVMPGGSLATQVLISVGEDAATDEFIDVDLLTISIGYDSPHTYMPAAWESQTQLSIAGFRQLRGTAAPASGEFLVGDIVWDDTPSAGGTMGWVCTVAGAPGTWKTFGAITA